MRQKTHYILPTLKLHKLLEENVGHTNMITGAHHPTNYEPHDDFPVDEFHHFPVLFNPDGTIWAHATLYLLSKVESYKQPNPQTLSSIASDLSSFGQALNAESIDYLEAPKRKLKRPAYFYRSFLQEQILDGSLSISTASRRMNVSVRQTASNYAY